MNLDSRQTRRLYLAGTTPFPARFPNIGSISLELGSLFYTARDARKRDADKAEEDTWFVVVKETPSGNEAVTRVVLQKDVAAIFFPGSMEPKNGSEVFRFSAEHCVEDFEAGEWFFRPDVNVQTIVNKLKVKKDDISGSSSIARGVIFVPEYRPVLTISEVTELAGSTDVTQYGSERRGWGGCECKW